jgi:hypothetical protein
LNSWDFEYIVRDWTNNLIKRISPIIKSLWEGMHFGQFSSEWRNEAPSDTNVSEVLLGKTFLYESRLVNQGGRWILETACGGLFGNIAFYLMLPIYAVFLGLIVTGHLNPLYFVLFEAVFIVVFGWLSGAALHHLANDPDFGVDELSGHLIAKV